MLEDLAGVLGMGLRPAGADRRWTTATDPSLLALRDFLRGRPDLGSLEDLGWEGASVDTDRVVDRAVQVFRAEARRRKDWAFADRLRDLLRALRVEVKDTPQGPRWEYLR
jgi:cysteinyl-tRNA synthetase